MSQNTVREFPGFPGGRRNERLAVILAGGEGSRLKSLTRAIIGDERPKQFCPIVGDRTLLDQTRNRIALGIAAENTYFSLTQKHEGFYERPLWNVAERNMIVQPENKGTAPAILFSLMRLAKSSPDAAVAFFPSDHYFADDEAFMEHVNLAFKAAEVSSNSIVLLGIEPEKPETSYGWIEPAESLFGDLAKSFSRVNRFWEKPTTDIAKKLMSSGCLWNSFVMVGHVAAFIDMFREHLPEMFRMFSAAVPVFGKPMETAVIRSIYGLIGETNFSSEVLERSADKLLVMRVGKVGWSDWGDPQRVFGSLTNLGIKTDWMQAMAA
jgi:mannose-1-phosphate guanylyltransferase